MNVRRSFNNKAHNRRRTRLRSQRFSASFEDLRHSKRLLPSHLFEGTDYHYYEETDVDSLQTVKRASFLETDLDEVIRRQQLETTRLSQSRSTLLLPTYSRSVTSARSMSTADVGRLPRVPENELKKQMNGHSGLFDDSEVSLSVAPLPVTVVKKTQAQPMLRNAIHRPTVCPPAQPNGYAAHVGKPLTDNNANYTDYSSHFNHGPLQRHPPSVETTNPQHAVNRRGDAHSAVSSDKSQSEATNGRPSTLSYRPACSEKATHHQTSVPNGSAPLNRSTNSRGSSDGSVKSPERRSTPPRGSPPDSLSNREPDRLVEARQFVSSSFNRHANGGMEPVRPVTVASNGSHDSDENDLYVHYMDRFASDALKTLMEELHLPDEHNGQMEDVSRKCSSSSVPKWRSVDDLVAHGSDCVSRSLSKLAQPHRQSTQSGSRVVLVGGATAEKRGAFPVLEPVGKPDEDPFGSSAVHIAYRETSVNALMEEDEMSDDGDTGQGIDDILDRLLAFPRPEKVQSPVQLEMPRSSQQISPMSGSDLSVIGDEVRIVRCRNSKCKRACELNRARGTFKTCHQCYTYYCSRECRQAHWPRHKKKCYVSNVNSAVKYALGAIRKSDEHMRVCSKVARTGFLSMGRGYVDVAFGSVLQLQQFLKSGSLPVTPEYVSIKKLVAAESDGGLVNVGKQYNPEIKFVLVISVHLGDRVPQNPLPRLAEPVVRKWVKFHLSYPMKDESSPDGGNGLRRSHRPETLILTAVPSGENSPQGRKRRELSFATIQRHLRARGVELQHQFPEVYQKLCSYVEGTVHFTPITIFPRDKRTNATFMCLIMPDAENQSSWLTDPDLIEELDLNVL